MQINEYLFVYHVTRYVCGHIVSQDSTINI